jgi:Beta-lactamase superfamily domain
MRHRLKTIGHATLVLFEDEVPLIATDPWLIGSVYWRSWWLEKYPSAEEFEQVENAKHVYYTHSHPDHFHYPTLRKLGKVSTLHPRFAQYELPGFLKGEGFPVTELEPWRWYELTDTVRIASIPVPIDDSILIIETPNAYIANLNDSVPRAGLLRFIRREMLEADKKVIVLKSYSPASIASSIYREGRQTQMKTKEDYAKTAAYLAEALGADYFVPFASQAFFSRVDSTWANDFKVQYEDLRKYWDSEIHLCEPFVDFDLDSDTYTTDYASVDRTLSGPEQKKVVLRQEEEDAFVLPEDFEDRLKKYMDELYFVSLFFRNGIGWRTTTSGREFFFNTRSKKIERKIPDKWDIIISLPDKVIYESLQNNILTDLGITMFIKVETRVSDRFTYGFFLLMGLHDYGHFNSRGDFIRFTRYYFPYFFPPLLRLKWMAGGRPSAREAQPI